MRKAKILAQALLRSLPQDRADFVAGACAGDAVLRREVEALLAAHPQHGGVLETPPAGIVPTVDDTPDRWADAYEQAGAVVGHYKLLQQIGEGGMGVVFMADQLRPVRRRVAVKIIKPGLDTRQVIARFEAERQALAMMDHPHIAKVLDAGATDAGRPYFVMELVRGLPITDYCDSNQLPTRERLGLFVQVCQAIQHAHTKGIIHRDLKPTNVLVSLNDGDHAPKIIDFGIAKATAGQRLTEQTLFTEFRQLVGTPPYMSPEQAEMSTVMDVDTRADVYSLGVLLYELLTGTTPFDKERLAKAGLDEVRRILREEDPPRPSTRLSTPGASLATACARRGSDPKRLGQLVRGELDWIVMKALEKDRTRRYETASGLARDVQRYLADEPVEASPQSAGYKLWKLVRRYRGHAAAILAVAVALVLGMVGTSIGLARATRNARIADAARIQVEEREKQVREIAAEALRQKRAVQVESAQRLISEGDALGMADRLPEATKRFQQAYGQLRQLGESTFQADLRLFSVSDYVPLNKFENRAVESLCAAILPAGRAAVVGGRDGVLRVYDLATGRELRSIAAHAGNINSVAVSPDGRFAVSAGDDGSAKVWDLGTGAERQNFRGHVGKVNAVAYFADGRRIISGGDDGVLRTWDAETARETSALDPPDSRVKRHKPVDDQAGPPPRGRFSPILCVALSPDGQTAFTGHQDMLVREWDLKAGGLTTELGDPDSGRDITSVAFTRSYVLAAKGEVAEIWDRQSRLVVGRRGHSNRVTSVSFSPTGSGFLTASDDNTVKSGNVGGGRDLTLGDGSGRISAAQFTPDGRLILSVGAATRLWDAAPVCASRKFRGHSYLVRSVAFSADGRTAVSGSDDASVRVWDVATGHTLRVYRGHHGRVRSVAFSPDSSQVLSGGEDSTVKLWDLGTGRLVRTMTGHQGTVSGVAFTLRGTRLVSAGEDKTVRVWSAASGQPVRTFGGLDVPVANLAVSADGAVVAASGNNGGIEVWDLAGLKEGRTMEAGRLKGAGGLALSPNGRQILAGDSEGLLELWDVTTGKSLATYRAQDGRIASVAFFPDGRTALVGGSDKGLTICDAAGHRELAKIPSDPVESVAVAADGRAMLAGGGERIVEVFDLAIPELTRGYEPRLQASREALQQHPNDGSALATVGEWYALHGLDEWACDLLTQARANGADVSPLLLARCHWRRGENELALKELQSAFARNDASPPYLRLCMAPLADARPLFSEWLDHHDAGHERTRSTDELEAGYTLHAPAWRHDREMWMASPSDASWRAADSATQPALPAPPPALFTTTFGGDDGAPFDDFAAAGGFMVGVEASEGEFGGAFVIRSMRPIYRVDGKRRSGSVYGVPTDKRTTVEAKPGYAIGAMKVHCGALLDGLRIVFMRVRGDSLDPIDQYQSDWIGGARGHEHLAGGEGRPVIGFYGRSSTALHAIGLIYSGPSHEPRRATMVSPTARFNSVPWRYTTELPADGWQMPGFHDDHWKRGMAGFGNPGAAPVRTPWTSTDIWVRREFTVKEKSPGDLRLVVSHDDTEVFLNGVPASPPEGHMLPYELKPINPAAEATLKVGTNVLAAHCQRIRGDQYFDVGIVNLSGQ